MAKTPGDDVSDESHLKYKTWVLKVSIHCEGCKKKVKRVLQSIQGVYEIDIESHEHKVTVTGNVDGETLVKKLLKTGKHAQLWPQNSDHHKKEHKAGKSRKKHKEAGSDPTQESNDKEKTSDHEATTQVHDQKAEAPILGGDNGSSDSDGEDSTPANMGKTGDDLPAAGQVAAGGAGGNGGKKKKKKKKGKKGKSNQAGSGGNAPSETDGSRNSDPPGDPYSNPYPSIFAPEFGLSYSTTPYPDHSSSYTWAPTVHYAYDYSPAGNYPPPPPSEPINLAGDDDDYYYDDDDESGCSIM